MHVDSCGVCGGQNECAAQLTLVATVNPAVTSGNLTEVVIDEALRRLQVHTGNGWPASYEVAAAHRVQQQEAWATAGGVDAARELWNVSLVLPGLSAHGGDVTLWSLPDLLTQPTSVASRLRVAEPLLHIMGATTSSICGDGSCVPAEASLVQASLLTGTPRVGGAPAVRAFPLWPQSGARNSTLPLVGGFNYIRTRESAAGSFAAAHFSGYCAADCPDASACVPPEQAAHLALALAVTHDGHWYRDDALPGAVSKWQERAVDIVHPHVAVRPAPAWSLPALAGTCTQVDVQACLCPSSKHHGAHMCL